jgi:hypothetical protein
VPESKILDRGLRIYFHQRLEEAESAYRTGRQGFHFDPGALGYLGYRTYLDGVRVDHDVDPHPVDPYRVAQGDQGGGLLRRLDAGATRCLDNVHPVSWLTKHMDGICTGEDRASGESSALSERFRADIDHSGPTLMVDVAETRHLDVPAAGRRC